MVEILCIVVTVMLWLFFLYHMWLVKKGYTTSENFKASNVEYHLENYVEFLKKWEKLHVDKKPFKPAEKTLRKYDIKKADMSLEEIRKELQMANKQLD